MLEKPDISDGLIVERLQEEYGLQVREIIFLPLGADIHTAVYRAAGADGSDYFLKLRKGAFDEISVAVPELLKKQGIQEVIAPLPARTGQLWGSLGSYQMILYPFVEGENGYEVSLTEEQWVAFGAAMRAIHAVEIPAGQARRIPREEFSPYWREMVKGFLEQVETTRFEEPVAAKFVAFLCDRRGEVEQVVRRADELGQALQQQAGKFVLCHSDIHPGNLLINERAFYIVDWDAPILAPQERDLMLIGGTAAWSGPRQVALFYHGYGETVDPMAIAYYRYERIIWDIAAYCEQLLLSTEGEENREQSYGYFTSIFLPGHEIDLAREADESG